MLSLLSREFEAYIRSMGPSRSIPALHASGLPKAHRNMDRAQWIRHLAVFPANLEMTGASAGTTQLCSSFAPKARKRKKGKKEIDIRNRNTDSQSQWQFFKGCAEPSLGKLETEWGWPEGIPSLKRSCCSAEMRTTEPGRAQCQLSQLSLQSSLLPRSSSSTPAITWAFLQSEKRHSSRFCYIFHGQNQFNLGQNPDSLV